MSTSTITKEDVLKCLEIMTTNKQMNMDFDEIRHMLFRCEENDEEGVRLYRLGNIIVTDAFMFRLNVLLETFQKYYVPAVSKYDKLSTIKLEFGLRMSESKESVETEIQRINIGRALLESEFVLCALLLNYKLQKKKKSYFVVYIKNKTRTVRNRII